MMDKVYKSSDSEESVQCIHLFFYLQFIYKCCKWLIEYEVELEDDERILE
jgi:hypothetical protein